MKTYFEIAKCIGKNEIDKLSENLFKEKIRSVLKLNSNTEIKISCFNFGWSSKTIDLIIENHDRLYHLNILDNDMFILPVDCTSPMNCKCYQT